MKSIAPSMIAVFSLVLVLAASWGWQPAGTVLAADKDKGGTFVRATIEANRNRGISVPRSAVFYRTEGPSVQVVRGNVIETRLVRVGVHSDTDTEIREGLREGDLMVANAGSSLRDGAKVKLVEADVTRMGLR
jgi:hypothetical protein